MIWVDNRNQTNPYVNLALEEYLVRHADCRKNDYILFYVNEPSIILGKNQSIYREINFEYLRNGVLKIARRITGGGTVYHDPGNLSFTIISSFADQKVNNYRYFNQPIVNALRTQGLAAEMDLRNNILLNGKKISGSAQFTDRKNIISHGTLLFNADLPVLRACLRENDFKIDTKAVGSVRSSVMNICEATDNFASVEDLQMFLIKELKISETKELNHEEWILVMELAEKKMKSYEWIYGRSPRTIIQKEGILLEVDNGVIQSIKGHSTENMNIAGVKYEYQSLRAALSGEAKREQILNQLF